MPLDTIGAAFNATYGGPTMNSGGKSGPFAAFGSYLESNFLGTPVTQWIFFTVTMMAVVMLWGMFLGDVKSKLGSV